ncbi:MAG: response regulator transcription factor [Calditrichia bacterium]
MSDTKKNVLIVEDDQEIAELIVIHLQDLFCDVQRATDGNTGLQMALNQDFDLIILDIMLPEKNGLEVLKSIRAVKSYTPILMLTAKTEELDKVLGLELGADDYLTKPFSIRELIARVKAIFRRVEAERARHTTSTLDEVIFDHLYINFNMRRVRIDGKPIELTAKEFELLQLFAMNPGKTYSRQNLLEQVWGYQFHGYDHTVNSHINRLRNKIERDPANPRFIRTLWGVGYRFIDKEELAT